MTSENRDFAVDRNILVSVIQSQAGTLGKALLEGVMNSVDAGATRVSIKLGEASFTLRDNGRGFQSKDEIIKWFETFGTPHKDGDARFGRFRMGRGQLYSFGVNTWRTGTFKMEVDIIGQPNLGYKLTENLPTSKGCRIDAKLYEALSAAALDEVVREFSELVRFAEIPVTLNGREISRNVKDQKWDTETDDAYIKIVRTGDLLVYNMGVLVCKFPNYEFGTGGLVVSKQALEVNFARNDILRHKCEVWRRIAKHMKTYGLNKVASKVSLTKEERDFLAREWSYGTLPPDKELELRDVKLFTDATGRHCSLTDLSNASRLAVARGSHGRIGNKLHREGKAFVLAEETLSRFRVHSLDDLLGIIEDRTKMDLRHLTASLESLALGCTETYLVTADEELPVEELCMLTALRQKHEKFHQWFLTGERSSGMRELQSGESDVALAWTDGASYIVMGRKELQKAMARGVAGCFELLLTLTHEYCHDSADLESHEHDLVFLSKHHDIVQYQGGKLLKLAEEVNSLYLRLAKRGGISLPARPAKPTSVGRKKATEDHPAAKAQLSLAF
ncbi:MULTISPECIES: ATP-binding protein [unclassified Variovorax]|uniref:ATP-binding protein n=1 Tax=unclassified Variovorax TaxID=663243 RepID=UPI00076C36DC|nr:MULTISPECIES: ATP-binding protein [unclassified Variovorax]KWT95530.1 hypothetical protein APY03_2407 [Variovorax sp. WDL1]PNG50134.1 hypothetical protein CHC06_05757 [Variovorax sp. B2]PNG51007.1 hypothetical protein CHC07_05663 [Variovorax sp. B4]VTU42008.1 hypothetical protein SRS16P1_00174 [Variovorax sp. SRS16]VTU42042.1 hypothetical protein E5P1_00172 [Variovorax sp. PBL-E5]